MSKKFIKKEQPIIEQERVIIKLLVPKNSKLDEGIIRKVLSVLERPYLKKLGYCLESISKEETHK